MSLNTGQAPVNGTVASFVTALAPGCTITLINNNASGAIAVGQSTAVTMSAAFGGGLIPAGQQVTFSNPPQAVTLTLYAIGAGAGTLSSFVTH